MRRPAGLWTVVCGLWAALWAGGWLLSAGVVDATSGPCPGGEPPAFPTAEGFGVCTKGGRGGSAIHVTNLDASGPGSLRACLEAAGPRTCVFRMGGTIPLGRTNPGTITIAPYLTIAGQSAPGDGIMVKGELFLDKTHDVIIRHLRIRPGPDVPSPADSRALTVVDSSNFIIDHCSFGWATDDIHSITNTTAITIQWTIFSEGLDTPYQPYGGIFHGQGAAHQGSYLHNLFERLFDRMPYMQGGDMQFVNNVSYNALGSLDNGTQGGPIRANIVNNFFMNPGPGNWIRNYNCS